MNDSPGFEAALEQLEKTVDELESGDLGLDASLAAYERGVGLLVRCHGLLDAAEKRVALLTGVGEDGSAETTPFDESAPAVEREAAAPKSGRDGFGDGIPY